MRKFISALLTVVLITVPAFALEEIQKEINITDMNKAKDAILSIVASKKGIRIVQISDYQVILESEIQNPIANLFYMNAHTGAQPVGRFYFDLIPASSKILIKLNTAIISNPGTAFEKITRNVGNKDDQIVLHNLLEKVAAAADPSYRPQFIEKAAKQIKANTPEAPKEKEFGVIFDEAGIITEICANSVVQGKLYVGDKILEINGKNLSNMDREAVKTYIANKWGSGASLVMLVQHNGEKDFVTIKKGE